MSQLPSPSCLSAKLNSKTESDKLDESEDKEFKALMADLGFTNQAALTSKSSSRYHTELAKQLSTFINKLFEIRKVQIITLIGKAGVAIGACIDHII